MNQNELSSISTHTLKRLPFYLSHLKELQSVGLVYISTAQIAKDLKMNEMQVKKDITAVTKESGKPRVGHKVENLIHDIESFLGYDNTTAAVLVGAGHLGTALVHYKGFEDYGLKIELIVDNNPELIGTTINNIPVISMEKFIPLCNRMHINIGIITSTKDSAQEICDSLTKAGIKAIWNFVPVKLIVNEDVIIQNENMASSLAVLSSHLSNKLKGE